MSSHAVLSPSAAGRWLTCTPSARLEQQFPDTSGDAAREGTVAHALGELMVRRLLWEFGDTVFDGYFKALINSEEGARYFNQAMYEHCQEYALFVTERIAEVKKTTPDALVFLEQRLDLTAYVPEGFGTGDCVIIADGTMEIIDLKFGKGVQVSAENNKQMLLYALGGLKDFDILYDIQRVRMTIYQPRISNYSSDECTIEDLLHWAENELKPKAALAFAGEGEFVAGSHCRFCKAKAQCKALADYNLEIARAEFPDPSLLSPEETADILSRVELLTTWVKAVEDYALDQAVNNGAHWPGYKIVEGRSNRVLADEAKALTLLKEVLPEDKIYKPRAMHGITELTKALGTKQFKALIEPLLIKPPGKPALVPASDKRPELNTAAAAVADFEGVPS